MSDIDPRLDRVYEEDWRSLDYSVAAAEALRLPRSRMWPVTQWLDQGQQGACVGFALAHELLGQPKAVAGVDGRYARRIYLSAQRIDPWPGGDWPGAVPQRSGTSVLSGAKVCKTLGFYSSYTWGLTLNEVLVGLGHTGPCVLGVNWYEGMDRPDAQGFLHPTGSVRGGHAILAHSLVLAFTSIERDWTTLDLRRSYVVLHNSWGRLWGSGGRAKLSVANLGRLLDENGDACFPVRTDKLAV